MLVRPAAAAIAAALAVVLLRHEGWLTGWPALAVAAVIVLALPTAKALSRRLLLTGCLFFGWLPVLWWWHLSLVGGRVTTVLALVAAGLAGWVEAGPDRPARLRALMPAVRPVDVLPVLAGVSSALVVLPWLRARTPVGALRLLLTGWDNAAHFDMVEMIRRHGVTIDHLHSAPDGSAWAYNNYPQGLHAMTAAVMELMGSTHPAPVGREVVGFVHATAVLFALMVAVVVAGVCSLPSARRRPGLAAPAAALVWAAFALGPGAAAMSRGFTNFVLACALAGCALVLTLTMPRPASSVAVWALGGAVVGTAFSWAPMLLLVLPSLAVASLWVSKGSWFRDRRQVVVVVLAIAATGTALLRAAQILSSHQLTKLVDRTGGIDPPSVGIAAALALGGAGLCLAAGARPLWRRREPRDPGVVGLAPLVGFATCVAIGIAQLADKGNVDYYFWKYASGVELVSVVALGVGFTLVSVRRLSAAVVVILTVGATQVFGYAGPAAVTIGHSEAAPGALLATERYLRNLHQDVTSSASRLLSAAQLQDRHPGRRVVFLALAPHDLHYTMDAELWLLSLSGTWTQQATNDGLDPSLVEVSGVRAATAQVEKVLDHDPSQLVAVGPDYFDAVRAALPPGLRDRVITWA